MKKFRVLKPDWREGLPKGPVKVDSVHLAFGVPEHKSSASKNGKKQRKRSRSRAYRFAMALSRKDRRVQRSSHGVFMSVQDLLEGKRSRKSEPAMDLSADL